MMYKKIIMIICFALIVGSVYSTVSGPRAAGTAVTSGSTLFNWSNPTNVLTDNTSAATATISGTGGLSNTLSLTNFGFTIPGGAVINGILVEIRMQGANGKTMDQLIKLRKTSGLVGNDKARINAIWPRITPAYIKFGSSTDLWGTTWTAADINSIDFGIDIIAKSKKQLSNSRVEYVRITVYYDQTQYYSKPSGNLNLLSSWGLNTDGSGTAPLNFTSGGQIFNLRNRVSPTLATNLTISGAGSKLVVGDATTAINFTIPSSYTYTGTVDISNNATLTLNNTSVPTLGSIANGSLKSYIVYGAIGNQTVQRKSYYRLTISGSGTKTLEGTANTEEKLVISSGAAFSDGGYYFPVDGDIENSGTHLSTSGGKLMMDGGSAQNIAGSNGVFGNLDIFNSSNVTLLTNISVSGILKFSLGSIIISSYTLTLNGTTTYESGSILGGASSNISIGGTASLDTLKFATGFETLYNLTVNRTSSGKITLATILNVQNTLSMTAGNIVNGTYTLTLGTSTSSRGTLNYTSGTIVGKFSRWFNNTTNSGTTGLFPVGNIDNYRPAKIEYTSAPSTGGKITAEFIASDPGDLGLPLSESTQLVDKAGDAGYWDLTTSGVAGGIFTGTFTATNFSGILDYTKLRLIKRASDVSSWTFLGTHLSPTGSNAVPVLSRTGFTTLGQCGIGGDVTENPLPVSLLFFVANRNNDKVELQWATASEVNSEYFEVEKSSDLDVWEEIIKVTAAGNSNVFIKYVTTDYNCESKLIYYRLKQRDFDGNTSLFKVIAIKPNYIHNEISLFPNPIESGNKLTIDNISLMTKYNSVIIEILNIEGTVIVSDKIPMGSSEYSLDAGIFKAGSYIIKFSGLTSAVNRKLVVY